MKRIIFIVSRNQPDIVPRLEKERRGGGDIEIVVDRRFSERRSESENRRSADRRQGDRRIHPTTAVSLIGLAVVVIP
jgi:hypothetical protein